MKYYITTSIMYPNADPHIGFALELLYSDVWARYQRLLGAQVLFSTGTDEHGQKIQRTAETMGMETQSFVDVQSAKVRALASEWNISYTNFIRTTDTTHIEGAQKLWRAAEAKGDIYKKAYTGLYCVGCESFKTEKDLIAGVCPDHKVAPETVTEENYFFRLSHYQKKLELLYAERPDFIIPTSRFNEMKEILKSGLEDVSISRAKEKLAWGIPVPGDESQVMYVWFDALANYLTVMGYGAEEETLFHAAWPADFHVLGKDINRFHALLWPAMLMSAGLEVPRQLAVHGWMTVDGQKMSKTIGNVINPFDVTKKYPLEAVRFFLLREIPFDDDGDFSYAKFEERYTADLANGLGNLTNRILTMVEKYNESCVPKVTNVSRDFVDHLEKQVWTEYQTAMYDWRFHHALETVWKFIAECDQLISDRKPWSLYKEGKFVEVQDLLTYLVEALRHIAIMISPMMPATAEKIILRLGLDPKAEFTQLLFELQKWTGRSEGNRIEKGEQLFPRLEESNI